MEEHLMSMKHYLRFAIDAITRIETTDKDSDDYENHLNHLGDMVSFIYNEMRLLDSHVKWGEPLDLGKRPKK